MKDNDIGCLGTIILILAVAFTLFWVYEIFTSDLPEWLKWYLIGG
jgi:cobalamin synthase